MASRADAVIDIRFEMEGALEIRPDAAAAAGQQAVAIGDGRPYNVALIVLDPDASVALATQHQIKRFKVLECDWPPACDELTPTMKLRRKPISAKYAAEIEALSQPARC